MHPCAFRFEQDHRTRRLTATAVAAPARGFPEPVLSHPQPQAWGVRIGRQHFDFGGASVGLALQFG